MRLAAGGCFARALAAAARLDLAGVLAGGFLSHGELADRTGSHPEVLLRLLQTLALAGVLERDEHGRFGLAASCAALRGDHPRSVRNLCILLAETYDDAFAALPETVRTGESGFRQVFGSSLYEHLEREPEAGRVFDAAMAELARPVAAELADRHDFSAVCRVIDVGGGDGTLLAGLLARHPQLEGICVDRPSVCQRAVSPLARLLFHPADIFAAVPAGGDRYLLKNVLHDWPPEDCLRLLTAVRTAMRGGDRAARLLVLEPMIEAESDGPHALFQLVLCETGTRGFTEPELRKLLDRAGFEVLARDQLPSGHHLLECAPAPTADRPTDHATHHLTDQLPGSTT
ncbi:methyltransferase [Kitasatospora sp. NBC_01266]|uniref:methyltransferase n=1 Tax=Kitasatospora sp. NBC_01266 TaxID=2903572 RepID=UPI002E369D25|nr:methyltransferase [Kitasatospora sp. NBC_01266]